MKRHSFRLAAAALGLLLVLPTGLPASAASSFDAGYYATHYPDVAAACGTDEGALLQHYIQFGASEGRKPSAWGRAGDTDLKADRRPDRGHLVAGAHQGTGQLQKPEAQDDR